MGRSEAVTANTGLTTRISAPILAAAAVLLASVPSHALQGSSLKSPNAQGQVVLAQAGGLKAGTNLNRTYIRRPAIQNRSLAITPNAARRVPLRKDISRTTKGAPKTARPRVFGTSGLETGLARDPRALRLRQGLKGTSDNKTGVADKRRLPTVKKDDVRKTRITKTKREPDGKKADATEGKSAPKSATPGMRERKFGRIVTIGSSDPGVAPEFRSETPDGTADVVSSINEELSDAVDFDPNNPEDLDPSHPDGGCRDPNQYAPGC